MANEIKPRLGFFFFFFFSARPRDINGVDGKTRWGEIFTRLSAALIPPSLSLKRDSSAKRNPYSGRSLISHLALPAC